METFQDLWDKMGNGEKRFELFKHNFIRIFIGSGNLRYIYICESCKTIIKRIPATFMFEHLVNIYNGLNEKDFGAFFKLKQLLNENILNCDEVTIKQIIQ